MTEKELKQTIAAIKKAVTNKPENKGKTEEEIDKILLDGFFDAFVEGKLSKDDLCAIAVALGYEPQEDILDLVEKELKKGA